MKAIGCFVLAVLVAGPATAEYFLTGNDLHKMCLSSRAEAQAYIMGFNDGVSLRDEVHKVKSICTPSTVRSGQLVDIVCNALENAPEKRHWMAAYITIDALAKAFPCQSLTQNVSV